MALSAATLWEVRTAGNDSNGGGFVTGATGTDFSQQNAAQYTFADLASSNGNAASPQVTSASHSFVASDVGNIMQITAGTNWTTGFYQIVSVAAGAATMDRAVGSVASLSAGTYAVGGALLTVQKAVTASVSGNIIYIQSGTYTVTSTISTTSGQAPLWIGYHTSRGDNDGTKPLITTATNSTELVALNGSTAQTLEIDNVNFSNTAVTPSNGFVPLTNFSSKLVVRNSKMTGFTNAINGDNAGAHFLFNAVVLQDVEIASCTSRGVNMQNADASGGLFMFGCYVHNNTSDGVGNVAGNTGAPTVLFNCIFDSNGGVGVLGGAGNGPIFAFNCDFSNNTSDGLKLNDGSSGGGQSSSKSMISNCVFYGNGGFGLNVITTNGDYILGFNNAFGANTSGATGGFTQSTNVTGLSGTITLTANPFTSGTNFAPNSTAGGGVLLKGAGVPTVFGSGTTNSINVGAVQTSVGAGASGILNRAVMTGGMYG